MSNIINQPCKHLKMCHDCDQTEYICSYSHGKSCKSDESLIKIMKIIKPEFFIGVSDFEATYMQLIDELHDLKNNSKLMEYV